MVHDASPVRLYEHGLHAEAVKRKAQRGLIYVKPVAVRLLCAATEPGAIEREKRAARSYGWR